MTHAVVAKADRCNGIMERIAGNHSWPVDETPVRRRERFHSAHVIGDYCFRPSMDELVSSRSIPGVSSLCSLPIIKLLPSQSWLVNAQAVSLYLVRAPAFLDLQMLHSALGIRRRYTVADRGTYCNAMAPEENSLWPTSSSSTCCESPPNSAGPCPTIRG